MFSNRVNDAFSNNLFTRTTIRAMSKDQVKFHASFVRLMEVALDQKVITEEQAEEIRRGTRRPGGISAMAAAFTSNDVQRLSNWRKRGVPQAVALELQSKSGIAANWLLTGEGPKRSDLSVSLDSKRAGSVMPGSMEVRVADDEIPGLSPIRVMKLRLRAGVSGFSIESDDEEAAPIYFRDEWLQRRGFKPYKLVATKVGGRSMEPTLYQDDVVVANTADTEPIDGEVYSINYEGEPVIKRLVRDGGEWWLTSDNSDKTRYPNKKWVDGSAIIIGRIVHRQSERI